MSTIGPVCESRTAAELERIIALRYQILRAPWGQPYESARDDLEDRSVNAYIGDETGNVIACGRLQENAGHIGQIRYMAVAESWRGKGLGKLILYFLERSAMDRRLPRIELQARENAVSFYEGQGYQVAEKSFLLWGQIQHYLMYKTLPLPEGAM